MSDVVEIGFFDSGIGGLSVLQECLTLMPQARFHYVADHAFHPYGEKSSLEVVNRCEFLVEQLIARGCGHVVIACNTATAVAIEGLRAKYRELAFVGIEPYLNILAKEEIAPHHHLGVLVTRATLESERFKDLKERLDPQGRLQAVSIDALAPFIERCLQEKWRDDDRLERELKLILAPILPLKWTHIILGCTHYPLISEAIAKVTGAQVIDPARAVASRLLTLLKVNPTQQMTAHELGRRPFFYASTHRGSEASEVALHWNEKTLGDFY